MKENEIWLQRKNESIQNYERFYKYLNFTGTLEQFITEHCSNVSKSLITKLSSTYKWKQRKTAYLNHNQKVVQNAKDKAVEKVVQNAVNEAISNYEKGITKLSERFLKILNNFEDLIAVLPPEKALDFFKSFPFSIDKFIEVKDKLNVDAERFKEITIEYSSGFDDYYVKNSNNNLNNNNLNLENDIKE